MWMGNLFAAMDSHPKLSTINYLDFHTFLRCASYLNDDISQWQPHTVPTDIAPDILPPSITDFLAAVVGLSPVLFSEPNA